MDVGTAEIIDEIELPKRRRSGRTGGSGPGRNGGGGNDPGGGGSSDNNAGGDESPKTKQFIPEQSRILTAFLIMVVMMTFGGLMAAYMVIATNKAAEWRPFDLPIQVWISSLLIFISSLAYHLGKAAVDRNDQPSAKKWFIVTTVLGAAFISSQLLAWLALVGRGLYLQGNPYAGFFYILTAVHAVHVLGGIAALGSILLRAWYPTESPSEIVKRRTIAQVVGWYWHFMGVLWLALFVLLGFWK